MGSRSGRHAALGTALAALVGCSSGAPTGFSVGDRWSAPLVGPLEDGLLVVPVYVSDEGPYLFAIDPDAKVSVVDQEVVTAASLRTSSEGKHVLDETDTQQKKIFAEVLDWKIGTLHVHRTMQTAVIVVGDHAYDSDGRRIHGVLGRDVIAESLVLGIDRDAGLLVLETQKAFHPAPDVQVIAWSPLVSKVTNAEVPPMARMLAKATVNGVPFTMHIDLGATASQLRDSLWDKAKLAPQDAELLLVDEVGTPRKVTKSATADTVAVGAVSAQQVVFVPYAEKRWEDHELDGTLGLDFFRAYNVFANWDAQKFFLRPREDLSRMIDERIGRWQSKPLGSCESPGCAKITLIDPLAGQTLDPAKKHPGVVVSIARDPAAASLDLEVTIAVDKPGLPWLVASLPKGTDRALTHLSPDYLGAKLTVVDASPFPRACAGEGGCIDQLQPR